MPELSVSVIVPAHNEEALLAACLESLLAQDFQGKVEIVVVDNASVDRTAEIARRYGVTVIPEPRRDYCLALIRGFKAARGDIIACTDADTVVPPDWLSRLVGEYQKFPEVVGVGGDVQFERPNWKCWLFARSVRAFNWLDRRNPKGPHLVGANMSVRRSAFLAVGGWNPAYSLHADSELSQRLRRVGRVVVIESLKVRTSSRRWNQALVSNVLLYMSNFLCMTIFARPLWRDFPVIAVREPAPRRTFRTAITAAGCVLVLAVVVESALSPRSSAFGKTYWHAATHDRVVALTFDDGPNEPYTSQVLEILKREHVCATFFLIGANVRRFPDTAARIVADGHVVGNHSDSHPIRFAFKPVRRLRAEVAAAEQTIHSATGIYPSLFRPPQGLRSPWLMRVLHSDSLIAVTWDDAPKDWIPAPGAVLAERAVQHARPGSIILLHDGLNLDHGADQSATVEALPRIIDKLRAQGYHFVTIPELLNCRGSLASWPLADRRLSLPNPLSNQRPSDRAAISVPSTRARILANAVSREVDRSSPKGEKPQSSVEPSRSGSM